MSASPKASQRAKIGTGRNSCCTPCPARHGLATGEAMLSGTAGAAAFGALAVGAELQDIRNARLIETYRRGRSLYPCRAVPAFIEGGCSDRHGGAVMQAARLDLGGRRH